MKKKVRTAARYRDPATTVTAPPATTEPSTHNDAAITALMQDIFVALRDFPQAKEKLSHAMDQRLATRTANQICSQCGGLHPRNS